MPDGALLLSLAFSSSLCGMAWLALAMKPHWQEACPAAPFTERRARALRGLGAAALAAALAIFLIADHASMAGLVFVMSSTISALIVAFTLAYRPRWLGWLALAGGRPR